MARKDEAAMCAMDADCAGEEFVGRMSLSGRSLLDPFCQELQWRLGDGIVKRSQQNTVRVETLTQFPEKRNGSTAR